MEATALDNMRFLLEAVRVFDITATPVAAGLFEACADGFRIYGTPEDNPGGLWDLLKGRPGYFNRGCFAKSCELVAEVYWEWEGGEWTGLVLFTRAQALWQAGLIEPYEIYNRPEDMEWAMRKIWWLWQASVVHGSLPPLVVQV